MFYQRGFFFRQLMVAAFLFFVIIPVTAQIRNQTDVVTIQSENISVVSLVRRAKKSEREGEFAKAVEDYKLALSLKPKDVVIYNNLGAAYFNQKLYTKALDIFKQAAVINPNLAVTHFNLSVVYDHLNRPKDAFAAVNRSLEIEPENTSAFILSCELKLVLKQNDEAAGCYESLQKITPLDGKSQTFYGLALLRTKKVNRAITVLEKAAQLAPSKAFTHSLLGVALHKKKRYKNAAAVFKRALEIEPENLEIRYNLAQTKLNVGDKAAALVHYKIIEEKNPALARELYKSIYKDKIIFVESK